MCKKKKSDLILTRVVSILCVVLMITSSAFVAVYAAVPNNVFAESISVNNGDTISIPVKIKSNSGFMGFSFNVKYDTDVLTPISVKRGELLNGGMFNDSITKSTNGSFKIVYSNTANVVDDGELFVISFTVSGAVSKNSIINITYNPDDCFDENWRDVMFNCEDINVKMYDTEEQSPPLNSFISKIIALFNRIVEMIKKLLM